MLRMAVFLPLAVLAVLATAGACDRKIPPREHLQPAAAGPGLTTRDGYDEERRLCVERTNEYRASKGLPALRQSPRLEEYAAKAARHDGLSHRPHDYFDRTDGGKIAMAENLVPWWSLARRGTVRKIVTDGLAFMWAEGPSGSHARHIAGPFTELGCGIFVHGDEVTVVQAFR
jgi:hypothetical protein